MRKIASVLFLILLSSTCYGNITLTKTSFFFDANSNNRNSDVTFSNASKEKQTYRIKIVNMAQLPDGSYEERSHDEGGFAKEHLLISPNKITLEPNESQTVRIQRKSMATVPEGEYVSFLSISEILENKPVENLPQDNNAISVNIRALYGVMLPVVIHKGTPKVETSIDDIHVKEENGKTGVVMTIKRSGNASLFVNIVVTDSRNKEIARLNTVRIYIPNKEREVFLPLENYKVGEKIKITLIDVYSNKIIYTADSNI